MVRRRDMTRSRQEIEELQGMINSFRLLDLQNLLSCVGKSKGGRKNELQVRAIEILKQSPSDINIDFYTKKIREIFSSAQEEMRPGTQMSMSNGQLNLATPNVPQQQHHRYFMTNVQNSPHYPQQVQNMSSQQNHNYNYMPHNIAQQQQPQQQPQQRVLAPVANIPFSTPQHVPNIRFKKLPFFPALEEIIKPTTLVPTSKLTLPASTPKFNILQECMLQFRLSTSTASYLSLNRDVSEGKMEYQYQLLVRICTYELDGDYDDFLPLSLIIRASGRSCTLPPVYNTGKPGTEPRRLPRPINISPQTKLCPFVNNSVVINWAPEPTKKYAIALYLVNKMSPKNLLDNLCTTSIISSDVTKRFIIDKMKPCYADDDEDEVATTMLHVSLMCPLGACRLIYPAKGKSCMHLKFFDANSYISLNEKKPAWTCPVCNNAVLYDDLQIYQYLIDILKSDNLPSDCKLIQLLSDGSWKPCDNEEDTKRDAEPDKSDVEMDEISDDDDIPTLSSTPNSINVDASRDASKETPVSNAVVDLTLDDEEQDTTNCTTKEDHVYEDGKSVSSTSNVVDKETSSNRDKTDDPFVPLTNGDADKRVSCSSPILLDSPPATD